MRELVLRFYLMVRKPRNFLKIVFTFIATSLSLHWLHGYDPDWGATNLILSIDATIASTIMLMIQEEGAEKMDRMLSALLAMAEAARERDLEQLEMMRILRDADTRLLKALTETEE
ncbi:hypothetical protein KDX40_04955 [Burkholderia ambifaria]|uniref:hypothetical protein n=1 Tax=Burkholderia ambifaria TaxID=152480 RepID=UPI001B9069E4|nr:hypothetical protein [Burkholderia ambifaria]MBR8343087.1 hypothetical protein [Burkholderia ambifaria]